MSLQNFLYQKYIDIEHASIFQTICTDQCMTEKSYQTVFTDKKTFWGNEVVQSTGPAFPGHRFK